MMYRYGKIVKFGNFSGGEKALNMYLKWILEETDFISEADNIKRYTQFAFSVNNKISGNKNIRVPKLYEELCTENIIVMEFIEHKTINQMDIDGESFKKVGKALNSYISSSFYALFNDMPVVFHGDPHNGNIYIDENGNIGFLDMGLNFELSKEDTKMIKDFFFAAFNRNSRDMFNLIIGYADLDKDKKRKFQEEIEKYCDELVNAPLTDYFVNVMKICLKYEVCPPDCLFELAKAFVCLSGINKMSDNDVIGYDLLKKQVIEYLVKKNLLVSKRLLVSGINIIPDMLENIWKDGVVDGTINTIENSCNLKSDIKDALKCYRDILGVINLVLEDSSLTREKLKSIEFKPKFKK